jgi:lactate dehydrogenase-like 2-hydroxyacid dehydrogenase
MSKTILVLGGLLPKELEDLSSRYDVLRLGREDDPEKVLRDNAGNIAVIVASPMNKVSGHLIEALPNLELICQFGVGVDNIDREVASRRGVYVTNTPDLVTADTADTALILMLGVARRAMEADLFVRVGKWSTGPLGMGVCMGGKTVGILGLGNIGKAIARRAEAFDMKIVYHGRSQQEDVPYLYFDNLRDMAESSDFLVCACPGTKETFRIINADILDALGPKGFLINIARGSVVDEEALAIALSNRAIAGAGLDVYENEPFVPEGLIKMDNVVLLPHIGTATFETRTKMGQLVLEKIEAHFAGRPLKTPVAA